MINHFWSFVYKPKQTTFNKSIWRRRSQQIILARASHKSKLIIIFNEVPQHSFGLEIFSTKFWWRKDDECIALRVSRAIIFELKSHSSFSNSHRVWQLNFGLIQIACKIILNNWMKIRITFARIQENSNQLSWLSMISGSIDVISEILQFINC